MLTTLPQRTERRNAVVRTDSRGTRATFVALLLVLVAVIGGPLVAVIWTAYKPISGGAGLSGLERWWNVVADPANVAAIKNTLLLVVSSTIIGTAIAFGLAILVSRTNVAGGKWLGEFMPIMSFLVPPLIGAFGWMFLGSPQAGLLNVLWRQVPGVGPHSTLLNIYSTHGIIIVASIYVVPFAYLYLRPAIMQVDTEFEEAAMVSGSSSLGALVRITTPIIRPAIIASVVVVVMVGLAEFSIPLVLGSSINFQVLSLRIWEYSSVFYPAQPSAAAALGILLLAPALFGLYLQRRLSRGQGRYEVIGGKGRTARRLSLGWWSPLASCAVWSYIVLAVLLPAAAIVLVALERLWTSNLGDAHLSLANFSAALGDPYGRQALWDSFKLSLIGASIGVVLALAISIIASRSTLRGRAAIAYLALVPLGTPSIVFAVGFLATVFLFAGALYGTAFLLLVGYVVVFLPLAMQVLAGGLYQLSRELGESSRVAGASFFGAVRFILIPLLARFLITAWLVLFVSMFRELPVSVLLAPSGSSYTSLYLVSQWQNALYPTVAAFGLVIFGINALIMGMLLLMQRRVTRYANNASPRWRARQERDQRIPGARRG